MKTVKPYVVSQAALASPACVVAESSVSAEARWEVEGTVRPAVLD